MNIYNCTTYEELLHASEIQLQEMFNVDKAIVYIVDEKGQTIKRYKKDVLGELSKEEFLANIGLVGTCISENKMLSVPDAYNNPDFNAKVDIGTSLPVICVPVPDVIVVGGRIIRSTDSDYKILLKKNQNSKTSKSNIGNKINRKWSGDKLKPKVSTRIVEQLENYQKMAKSHQHFDFPLKDSSAIEEVVGNNKIIGAFEVINKKGVIGRRHGNRSNIDFLEREMLDYFINQFGISLNRMKKIYSEREKESKLHQKQNDDMFFTSRKLSKISHHHSSGSKNTQLFLLFKL
jgi:hypothetical protein